MIQTKCFVFISLLLFYVLSIRASESAAGYVSVNDSNYESYLIKHHGMVDIHEFDSTIKVELKYASEQNFMGTDVYGHVRHCFLRLKAAEKLSVASACLRESYPGYRLLVADGFRPRQVQREMYALVKYTPMKKYIAYPATGSMHNYGCAVDVTIIDSNGYRLDMGTDMDDFSQCSQPRLEKKYVEEGMLLKEHIRNRRILRDAMIGGGFHPLSIEWWHFDAFLKPTVRKHYYIID